MQEDINKLQNNMVKIQADIGYIKEALTDNKLDHEKMMEKIDKWIEASERRFAPSYI